MTELKKKLDKLIEQREFHVELLKKHRCKNYVKRIVQGFDIRIQELKKKIRMEAQ